ncbi:unnamed protein product [Coffea canephora]|uniref:Pentacotripeptide-repeat region of PRORP domain-containing protein n=1 Tax=Coffea canephora TaxID=49390 RepID=A0A068U0Y2_COFCA|nr:unnamed protein product [Coffea canephora]
MLRLKLFPSYSVLLGKSSINYCSKINIFRRRTFDTYIHHHLFDDIPQKDISSLNSLLNSHARNGEAVATWDLFLKMHCTRTDLNSYTFTPVLTACATLLDPKRGHQVHALMIKLGVDCEIVAKTALIDLYSKYGQLGDSVSAFYEMRYRDVVAWNAILSSYLRHGLPRKALELFADMRKERVEFSEFTLCSALKACASSRACQQGKQIHAVVIVMGRDLVVLSTALINFYSHLGQIDAAMKIYRTLSCRTDDVMFNTLISGCVRNKRYDAALSIMSLIRPNAVALTSALSACSENSDIWIGKQIHGVVIRQGFTHDTQLSNAVLDMYAKCGKIREASLVFDRIARKDVVSWTSMIDAYGVHGYGAEAIDLFKRMEGKENNDVLPNSVSFLAVLSACARSGLVEQGRKYFYMFQEKYGLVPAPEHYACFIDILGRAGQIEEAWSLFPGMVDKNIKPSPAVWAAVVNACRINLDVERGEFAAKCLIQLEPNNPGNYVALSNFFAAIGRWDSVDALRSIMKRRGIIKGEGGSWVTMHKFGDKIQHEHSGTASFGNLQEV